ncbi:hypothetical protein M514_00480 [Trichuris suis]|uniref:Uncharacterized protein n=1 Tax=Trichuris suis TaxID=68888 RepID=A0A085NRH6_9BILA|nr:hypothetical protein M513_00480 [Trichuris suis]KFD72072.1 hypothetical protein M514_00480 [Trichuris suis]
MLACSTVKALFGIRGASMPASLLVSNGWALLGGSQRIRLVSFVGPSFFTRLTERRRFLVLFVFEVPLIWNPQQQTTIAR